MTTQPMAGIDYPAAIRLVLRSGSKRKTRDDLLSYFHPTERVAAADVLAIMVAAGEVKLEGGVYSLSRSR